MGAIVDKMKLSEKQDRRIKITSDKKNEIRDLYSSGEYSLNDLAKIYKVSKKTILLTVNKKSYEKNKEYRKKNWKTYQRDKNIRNEYTKKTREYKKKLYLKGELK